MSQRIRFDFDGVEHSFPARYEICSRCEGAGKSSAYLGAFSAERMEEEGPDFQHCYMRGEYDRPCEACDGTGKVLEPDVGPRSSLEDREALALYEQLEEDRDEMFRTEEAERRRGA